jgi:hypothetical protein
MYNNVGKEIADTFEQYLKIGNNPDEYPIGHMDILRADAKGIQELADRAARWAKNKRTALIGATKWSLCGFLHDGRNHDKVNEQGVKNLAAFMKAIGEYGFADMVDSMLQQLGQGFLPGKIAREFTGTELEQKLAKWSDIYEKRVP